MAAEGPAESRNRRSAAAAAAVVAAAVAAAATVAGGRPVGVEERSPEKGAQPEKEEGKEQEEYEEKEEGYRRPRKSGRRQQRPPRKGTAKQTKKSRTREPWRTDGSAVATESGDGGVRRRREEVLSEACDRRDCASASPLAETPLGTTAAAVVPFRRHHCGAAHPRGAHSSTFFSVLLGRAHLRGRLPGSGFSLGPRYPSPSPSSACPSRLSFFQAGRHCHSTRLLDADTKLAAAAVFCCGWLVSGSQVCGRAIAALAAGVASMAVLPAALAVTMAAAMALACFAVSVLFVAEVRDRGEGHTARSRSHQEPRETGRMPNL